MYIQPYVCYGVITAMEIFWEFWLLYQFFFSPQVKKSVIISNKHDIYELPRNLENDLGS